MNHKVDLIAGYTAQKERIERSVIESNGFTDDQITTINGIVNSGDEVIEEWSLVSALARLNYVFKINIS